MADVVSDQADGLADLADARQTTQTVRAADRTDTEKMAYKMARSSALSRTNEPSRSRTAS